MTSLPNFVEDAREEVLDKLEEYAREEIAPQVQGSPTRFSKRTAVSTITTSSDRSSGGETEIVRRGDRVVVRFGWPEPAIYFERGTVEHVVEAKNADALSFVWEDPPSGSVKSSNPKTTATACTCRR